MTRVVAFEPGEKVRRRSRIFAGGRNVEPRHIHELGLVGRAGMARITSFQRSSCQSGTPIRSIRAPAVVRRFIVGASKCPKPWPEALRISVFPVEQDIKAARV